MKHPVDLAGDLADIPLIVGTGLQELRQARYLLLKVEARRGALDWLKALLGANLVHGLGHTRRNAAAGATQSLGGETVTIGFSYAGLGALGLKEDGKFPFPSAFRGGMSSRLRRKLMGDDFTPDWKWGDENKQGSNVVHIFVAHYWHDTVTPSCLLDPASVSQWGLKCVRQVSTCAAYIAIRAAGVAGTTFLHEPFGFRDGIGQPVLDGLGLSRAEKAAQKTAPSLFKDRLIQPGEFVLGQRNEYQERSYCPNVDCWNANTATSGFARNGTYLAVRQIEQHVAVFDAFAKGPNARLSGELLIGRKSNGDTLVDVPQPPSEIDAYRYLEYDANGFACPRGAHARRANPRDALAQDVDVGIQGAKLHRLLRRGRVYTNGGHANACRGSCGASPNASPSPGPCGNGLMFVAVNADLERQFEFIQRAWINGSRFGDLSNEQDPLLGTKTGRSFSVQGCPIGERVAGLPRFTTVLGGGYFLVPGLKALDWLANRP